MTSGFIGPYRILSQVGAGPLGMVYCVAAPDGHRLALKALGALTAEQRDILRQSDIINRRLLHTHIISWLAADFDHDPPYVVMPYLSGGSLADRLRAGPMPPDKVLGLLRPVILSLDYAHALGVTHGNLKPSNVLFDAADLPYLSDFGFGDLTRAPETQDWLVREARDVRAIGALVFQAITGQGVPAPGASAHAPNPPLPAAVSAALARFFSEPNENLSVLVRGLSEALGLPFVPLVHNTVGQATRWVGREAELRQLQTAYRAVQGQAGLQAVLVTGDDGMGKTRLVDELLNWVIDRPELCRYIHTRMRFGNPAYSLLRAVVYFRLSHLPRVDPRPIADRLEWMVANLLGEQPGPHHQETAHVIGQLAGFNVQASPYVKPLLADPQELARRGQQLFLRWVTAASRKEPVILVVDDAHLADSASQNLLQLLVSTRQRDDILVVLVSRPGFYERRAEWHGLLQHIALGPLNQDQCLALIQSALNTSASIPSALTQLVTRYAEGNPALMTQWLQRLVDIGVLAQAAPGIWQVDEQRLGEARLSLTDLLNDRVRSLPPVERMALRRAAVLGAQASLDAICALDDVDGAVADWSLVVQALVARNFLRPETAHIFSFVPLVLGETVYASIPTEQRRHYHQAVAHWLAQHQPQVPPRVLARHYAAAGQETLAAACLLRAAEAAWHVSAYHETLHDAQAGLAVLANHPWDDLHSQLQLQLAEASHSLGRYAATQEALDVLLAQPLSLPLRLAAQVLAAANMRRQGDSATAYQQLSALLPAIYHSAPAPLQLRALIELGAACWRLGHLSEAAHHHHAALDLATRQAQVYWVSQALLGLGIVHGLQDQLQLAHTYLEQAYARAAETGNRRQMLLALNNLGIVAVKANDVPQALMYAQQALEIARELEAKPEIAMALSNLAEILILQQHYDQAYAAIHQALQVARDSGALTWQITTLLHYADALHQQQRTAQVASLWHMLAHHPAADYAQRAHASQRLQSLASPVVPDTLDLADWVDWALRATASAG